MVLLTLRAVHKCNVHRRLFALDSVECMDFGYPQNCAIDLLRLYINLGTVRVAYATLARLQINCSFIGTLPQAKEDEKDAGQLTSQITGIVDWCVSAHAQGFARPALTRDVHAGAARDFATALTKCT